MTEPRCLDVKHLEVSFTTPDGEVEAVRGIDLQLRKGTILGLVGESGCGKSTTIKGLLGLLGPNANVRSERANFEDFALHSISSAQLRSLRGRDIGFVAQNPFGALNPIYPIKRQFYEVHKAHKTGLRRAESRARAHEQLVKVGIVDPDRVLDGYAHQLSGGMAQRVVIALATILSPTLLVADEPTTGLDVTVQAQIMDLLLSLVRDSGMSMLIVTHDLGVVAQYCDDVMVMRDGDVVESGAVMDVFVNPTEQYTKTLLSSTLRGAPSDVRS